MRQNALKKYTHFGVTESLLDLTLQKADASVI